MDSLKLKTKVLKTYKDVEEGALLYFNESRLQNPFLVALGLTYKDVYEQTFKSRIQTIADQQLSVGLYNQETGELLCALIASDAMTEYPLQIENSILKAQETFFIEGKKRLFQDLPWKPKFGEIAESMISSTKPEYMNKNLAKILEMFMIKHHTARGYKYQYGECAVPTSQYVWETFDVPYYVMRWPYREFKYNGEKVFKDLDFGDTYPNGLPSALFFVISYDNLVEMGFRIVKRILEQKQPKL